MAEPQCPCCRLGAEVIAATREPSAGRVWAFAILLGFKRGWEACERDSSGASLCRACGQYLQSVERDIADTVAVHYQERD